MNASDFPLSLIVALNSVMNYTIIEDCSPFYIRYTYPNAANILNICRREGYADNGDTFIHHRYPLNIADEILANAPYPTELRLNRNRVSLFVTKPGRLYRAHKDGANMEFSLNFHVTVKDENCETSWYSDEELAQYDIDTLGGHSRECIGFIKKRHTPLKTMVAVEGECTLFNTNIFHSFDNRLSKNTRAILTLRDTGPQRFSFDEVRKILFNIPQ